MTTLGVDYSGRPPGGRALRAAGYSFACRYLSPPPNTKNLTDAEARALLANGIDVVTVWESTAGRALSGLAGGVADGQRAKFLAGALGAPEQAAIYYAVDFDAQPGQLGAVGQYQDGFAAAIAPHPVGVYGGYRTVAAMLARGAKYGWQTAAWSGGKRLPAAALYQRVHQIVVGGTTCDVNEATGAYGGWLTPTPTQPNPLPLPPAVGGPEEDTVLIPFQLPTIGRRPDGSGASGYWDTDGNPGIVGDPKNPPRPLLLWEHYRGVTINGDEDSVDDNDDGQVRARPLGLPDGRQIIRISYRGFPAGNAPLVWIATNTAT